MKRKMAVAVCLLLILWFWLPFFGGGILHVGMVYPTLLLLALAAVLGWWPKIRPLFSSRYRGWMRLACVLAALGWIALAVPLGCMTAAAHHKTDADAVTVVVPGCQVRGTVPSLMLAARCDAAYAVLTAHPDAVCVACGGQGPGEDVSEAQAIFDYLTAKGIAPDRIYREDTSRNTAQNMDNAAAVIRAQALPATVVIATDNFHQYRAALYARRAGLTPYAAGCPTVLWLAPGYWAREVPAIYQAWLRA